MEIIQSVKDICKNLDELDEYVESLGDKLSIDDIKEQDLLHLIENEKMNCAQCCRVIKEIRETRNDRRKVKNDIAIAKVFQSHKNKLISKENRAMLLSEIFKREKTLNCDYKYQKYTEEDINKIMS